MALPTVRTVEDIFTVMRQNRRWRRRQRVLALKRCKRQLMILRMRGDVTPQQVVNVNRKLMPMLNREEQLLLKETPKHESLETLPEVTDAAQKFANENKIDLSQVDYTNKITIKDVRAYANPAS